MALPVIEQDKANHFVYGAISAAVGAMYDPLAGAALCFVLAWGKEIYDRVSGKGTPDKLDAIWTMLGGAVALAPVSTFYVVAA